MQMPENSMEFGHPEYPTLKFSADVENLLRSTQDLEENKKKVGMIDSYEQNLQQTLREMGY